MRIPFPSTLFLAMAAFAVSNASAWAELSPSFNVAYSAKHATHILVVDGKGTVLASWRGDLAKGDRVPFPAKGKPIEVDYDVDYPVYPNPVRSVTGNRRVLFLIRSKSEDRWLPANVNEPDLKLATVWIEEGECFANYQFRNPGPAAKMHPLYVDEAGLKKQVLEAAETTQSTPKPPEKTTPDLAGKWRVLLPAGFEYEISLKPGQDGTYQFMPANLTFSGLYKIQEDDLVSVPNKTPGGFRWKINSPYLLTLTEQTASVGSDYTGAVLFRPREEVKRKQ